MKETTMAEANEKNVDVAKQHDRVVMLSLRADGTPDQIDPEIIGDKEFATAAAKRQFAEQAVAAADDAKRQTEGPAAESVQDPTIAATQAEHEKLVAAAEKTAAAVVNKLHN